MIKVSPILACALTISSLFVSSCAQRAPSADSRASITDEEVIEAIRDYHSAWEALDFDRVAAFHTDDFEYLFFTDLLEADAFPEILSDAWMAGVKKYEINEEDFRVLIIEPNHAHVTLLVSDRSVLEDGGVAHTSGAMTYLIRRDETWKIRRLHHGGAAPDNLYESGDAP